MPRERSVSLLLALAALAAAPRARAERQTQRPVFLFDLPPEPPVPSPPPGRDQQERPRRAGELVARLGFALPVCHGDASGLSRCDSTETGEGLGLGALWRVAPHVALGLEGSVARFGIDAASGWARSSWVGAVVRGYFLDRGWLDPYVQTGLGRGSIDTAYDDGAAEVRLSAAGLGTMVGAGLDFWISGHVKAGPAVFYHWTFFGDGRACAGGVCSAASVATTGAVASSISLSLVLSAAIGPEM